MKIVKKLFSGLIALAMIMSCAVPAIATTDTSVIYVSAVGGDDSNLGTLAAPLKTIDAARKMARGIDGHVTVEIMGGEYRLQNDISFTEEDSNVTYRAYNGEKPVIKGSKQISTSAAQMVTEDSDIYGKLTEGAKNNTYVVDLASQGITQAMLLDGTKANTQYGTVYGYEYNSLYIDEVEQTIAQWPNNRDYAEFDKVNDTTSIVYKEDYCDKWSDETGWWIGMWMPYDYSYFKFGVVSVDTENNIIKYIDDPVQTFEKSIYSKRWKAYNLIEEMDVPGEYYIDRDNLKLYYYSPKAISNQKIELDINLRRMITVSGAENISFEGLTFAQTNSSVFSVSDVVNVDIKNCVFQDIGYTAVGYSGGEPCVTGTSYTKDGTTVEHWQRQKKNGSYNVDVSGNIFHNIGGTAISMSGAGDNDTLTPSGNVIENNIFSNIGYKSVDTIISIGGCGVTVRNNNISKSTIGAIYVTGGNNHLIEKNEIYNVMTESSDWGAFYEGGNDVFRGTEVNYNYIHDMVADDNKTYEGLKTAKVGIYFDENQQDLSAEHNIIKNVPLAFNSNHAGNFVYQYNTAVDCERALTLHDHPTQTGETVKTGALGLTLAQIKELVADNELFYTTYPTLKTFVDDGTNPMKWTVINENLEIGCGENKIGPQASNYSKLTNNNEIADYTVFNNPDSQDYRLKADAEIVSSMPNVLNTSNFDIEEIGLQTDFQLNEDTASFANIFPAKGSNIAYQEEYNFSWEPALGANNYKLTVATDEEFENVIFEKTTMQTAAVVTGLSDETVYYYKVEAENISRELGTTWLSEGGVVEFGINVDMYEDTATPEKPANRINGNFAAGQNGGTWTGEGIPDEMKEGSAVAIKMAISSDRTDKPDNNWYATGIFLKDKNKNEEKQSDNAFLPEANTDYVFKVKARSVEGNVRIGLANINTWGNYVVADHGRDGAQVGTDWTEVKTTLSTVDNSAYNFNYLSFGIVTGTASDYIVYDANSMYLAEEIEYSMSIEGDDKISVGESKVYSAEVLNQLGEKGALSQDFEWLVLNESRTAQEEGLTILENADGTATLTGAKAGIYTIIARTEDGFTKGMKVKVVSDYNDTATPEKPANMVTKGANGEGIGIGSFDATWYGGNGSSTHVIEEGHNGKATEWVSTADRTAPTSDWWPTMPFYLDPSDTQAAGLQGFEAGKSYVISMWAKDSTRTEDVPMTKFTATINRNIYSNEYPKGQPMELTKDWQEFKGTYKLPANYDKTQTYGCWVIAGHPTNVDQHVGQAYVVDDFYVAEEIAYSMNIEGANNMMVGQSKTYSAEILNQLGLKGALSQDFEWTVLNADRTQTVDGMEVTENADGTVTVKGVKGGTYTLLATAEEYEFLKGIEIEVISAEDTATPERPANILSKSVEIGDGNKFQNTVGNLTSQGVVGRTDNTATKIHNFAASDSTSGNWMYLKGAYVKKAEYKVEAGQDPATAFEAGESYIMSMWVKDARASEDIKRTQFNASISYGAEGSEARKKVYTAEYPKGTNLELNDEWQEFKGSFTMPDDYYTLQYGLFFGQPEEVVAEVGQGFVIDDIFVEKEIAYSMNILGDSRVAVGEEKIYSAELLNQLGIKGALSQDFNWALMTEDRSALADGATVVENADGTVTVTGAEAGTYTLVAISEDGFVKGKLIKVISDYSDTETPAKPSNMMTQGASGDGNGIQSNDSNWYGGNGSSTCVVEEGRTGVATLWKATKDHKVNTWYAAGPFGTDSAKATGMQNIQAGKTYVFSIWAKDVSDESVTEPVLFTAGFGSAGSTGGIKYSNEYPNGTNMTVGKEWTNFAVTYTLPADYAGSKTLWIGYPSGVQAYTGQAFLVDDFYFAEEVAYSMNILGDTEIEAGVEKTYSAELLNQIGTKGTLSQDFKWFVMNEDRSAKAEDVTLVENADGTVTITALEEGTYTLLALSEEEDFIKGYTVIVTGGEEPQEKIATADFVKSGTSVNFKAEVENTDAENIFFVIGEFNGNSLVKMAKSVVKDASDPTCDLTLENVTVGNTIRAFIWDNQTLLPIDNVDNLALDYAITE